MLRAISMVAPGPEALESLGSYREVWLVQFEYDRPSGEPPRPTRLVAREVHGGRALEIEQCQLAGLRESPFAIEGGSLLVAYDAPAALGCMLSLGWLLPANVLGLGTEFRCHASGLNSSGDWGFSRALEFYGAHGVSGESNDPTALKDLLCRMLPIIDLERALLRGRYTAAVARMERVGIPVDLPLLTRLRDRWPALRASLIERVDRDYGVFDGTAFRRGRWANWLAARGIPWPRDASGWLRLDDDTFRDMAVAYPAEVRPMWELRKTLSKFRIDRLAIGRDGRNRTPLRPFASKTGRNQPSASQFLFGAAAWVRGLIRPDPGMALAYVDYEQQEFGIGAALSGDEAMMVAYASGDPYMGFAIQSGAVPPGATKESHREARERFKVCALGIQYGMRGPALATMLRVSGSEALELKARHRAAYPRYWSWTRGVSREGKVDGVVETVFGWRLNVRGYTRQATVRNFPLQANGAEILRLACCMLIDRGIRVCAPVHDAVLIEAPEGEIDEAVDICQEVMTEASSLVLGGFRLRTEARVVRHPERYMDPKGRPFWDRVCELMGEEGA